MFAPEVVNKIRGLFLGHFPIKLKKTLFSIKVFVHKVDGLSDETKMETHRKIFQTVQDDLADQGMDHIRINYHMTS